MKRLSFLILSATILLLASCGKKSGNTGLMVPKDALFVAHINSPALSSKLTWDEIKQSQWFRQVFEKETDSLAKQLFSDPASSGIDLKKDFVYYWKKEGNGGYGSVQGSLSDAAKFEQLLKKMAEKDGLTVEVKKDGDFSYIESNGVTLWNSSGFAHIDNVDMSQMSRMSRGYGSSHEFGNDSLLVFGKQALTLKSGDNLDTDSRFAELIKDGSDFHIWSNIESAKGSFGPMAGYMSNLELLFKGNLAATSFNFDNGQIVAKTKVYCNSELTKLLEKYKPGPVSTNVINRIPAGDVAAVIAFNYPPQGLFEFLKVLGVDGWANMGLSKMGYSVEEFVKANKGEVVLAVSDLGSKNTPDSESSRMGDVKVLFATAVNDKAAFEKLVTIVGGLVKNNSGSSILRIPEISYKLENDWFAASNSTEQVNSFIAGAKSNHSFASRISGHPYGMYIDLQKIITATSSRHATDSASQALADASIKMWQDMVSTGGEFKDKAIQCQFEINLVDKNTNSLKQLNQYFDKMTAIRQASIQRHEWKSLDEAEPAPAPAN